MTKHGLHITILLLMFSSCAYAQCVPGGLAVVVNKANPSFAFRWPNTIATSSARHFAAMIPWSFKPWIPMPPPAAEPFIAKQCKAHLKIEVKDLTSAHLKSLSSWIFIGGANIMDRAKALELSQKVAAL